MTDTAEAATATADSGITVHSTEKVIGSPEKIALWQEMGTSHIPPRPVCEPAMKRSLPYAADVFGEIAVAALTGKAIFK